jgi:hypothetical protein
MSYDAVANSESFSHNASPTKESTDQGFTLDTASTVFSPKILLDFNCHLQTRKQTLVMILHFASVTSKLEYASVAWKSVTVTDSSNLECMQ